MAFAPSSTSTTTLLPPLRPTQAEAAAPYEDDFEYSVDVYLWKHELQFKYYVPDPLQGQAGLLTPLMRRTLLGWLVAVNRQFGFSLENWCLAVSILDR